MQAIGVLDSGLGGLSILQQIWQDLPFELTIYLADSKYAPYGIKSKEFLCQRSLDLCRFLCRQKVKIIVIACNTATTNTIAYLRSHINHIPIIGVEPGIKPALSISKNKHIGILATHNTIISDDFNQLMQGLALNYQQEFNIIPRWFPLAANGLVELIENGNIHMNNQELVSLCKNYIDFLMQKNVDTIVLGCTHYPFLLNIFSKLYPTIKFIETAEAVVNHLKNTLLEQNTNVNINEKQNIVIEHKMLSSLNSQHLMEFVNENCRKHDRHKFNSYLYNTYYL